MIDIGQFRARSQAQNDALPLLTLDEFFTGNTDEDSIAPNQWLSEAELQAGGDLPEQRPTLAEIAGRLRELEARDDVAWTRVQPHPDALDEHIDFPVAEAIAVCSAADVGTLERHLDIEWLQADGVIEGFVLSEEEFCDHPPVPEGYAVYSLVWD